jgi:hypothetical protein
VFPDWVGTTQEHMYEFEGVRLSLSTGPIPLGGQELRLRAVWERAVTL